ncbi:MAG: YiiD C-terminal domain-containing protein [Bacteroidia bacterium]
MKLLGLAYNQNINLQVATKPEYIFMLVLNKSLENHIHSFHAAAIFSLAEASSAQYLIITFKEFENSVVPLLRATNTKYKKPAQNNIYAKAILLNQTKEEITNNLIEKNRALVTIKIDIFDEEENMVFTGNFEWFLSKVD